MRLLRMFFALPLTILFVVSSVLVLLFLNIEQKAFSSETYKQAFANQGLYQRLPALLANTLTTYIGQNGSTVPFLQVLTPEDWQNSIATLIPPQELQQMGDQALDATFDYLNGRTDSATLSLVPVKTRLAGEAGMQIVLQILSRQPACTTEQLTQMALGLFGGQVVLCNPPPEALGLMTPFIQTQLQSMVLLFPDEVTIIPGTASGTPADPRLKLNAARSAVKLTPFIPAFLLIGIGVFAVRSLADWLGWWGAALMFAGGAGVLVGLFGSPLVAELLQFLILTEGTALIHPALASSIAETAGAVAREMLIPVVYQGFIVGCLGLLMTVAAMILAKRERERILASININPIP